MQSLPRASSSVPMATLSAHTASPLPPSRTPAGSRALNRHASTAPRTTSAHDPLAWLHDELVFIDQSQLRQRLRESHSSHEQSLSRLARELLNGAPPIAAHGSAFQSAEIAGSNFGEGAFDVGSCRLTGDDGSLEPARLGRCEIGTGKGKIPLPCPSGGRVRFALT